MRSQSTSKKITRIFSCLSLFTILSTCLINPAIAEVKNCVAKVTTKLNLEEMKAMSKISMAEAQTIAVNAVGKKRLQKIQSSELEVEDACLIYSFDIKLKNKTGISEIAIDAVSGMIISKKHETPKQEALEKVADQKK